MSGEITPEIINNDLLKFKDCFPRILNRSTMFQGRQLLSVNNDSREIIHDSMVIRMPVDIYSRLLCSPFCICLQRAF